MINVVDSLIGISLLFFPREVFHPVFRGRCPKDGMSWREWDSEDEDVKELGLSRIRSNALKTLIRELRQASLRPDLNAQLATLM